MYNFGPIHNDILLFFKEFILIKIIWIHNKHEIKQCVLDNGKDIAKFK